MAGKPEKARANNEPRRADQVRCPRCGSFGCPAINGSKYRTDGRHRFRCCSGCHYTFETRQRHGSLHEELLA